MISVAIATYNGEKYIEKQLRSVLTQTKRPDEIIISDDVSTDRTLEIIREICREEYEQDTPVNIKIIENEKNQGYIRNFRTALEACRGNVIFLCDQDDIWLPEKIARMTSLMEKYPQIQALASSFSMIDGEGKALPDYDRKGTRNQKLMKRQVPVNKIAEIPTRELIYHNFCQGCAMAFTAEVRDRFLAHFTPEIAHDWQLNLLASVMGGTYFYNRKLFRYRIHENNTTGMAEGQDIEKKKTREVRMTVPRQGLANLNYLKKNYPQIFRQDKSLQKRLRFTEKNLQAMQKRRFFALLGQNLNPFYAEMKSFLGRMLDLWYVVKRSG